MSQISILVLEDNLELGTLLVAALDSLGYTNTHHVLTLKDALSALERDETDLCILDVQHGHDTCETVAAEAIDRGVRVILTSGGETLENARLADACVFLQKPSSTDALDAAIKAALS